MQKRLADVDDIEVWRAMHEKLVQTMTATGKEGGGCTREEASALLTLWASLLIEEQ